MVSAANLPFAPIVTICTSLQKSRIFATSNGRIFLVTMTYVARSGPPAARGVYLINDPAGVDHPSVCRKYQKKRGSRCLGFS